MNIAQKIVKCWCEEAVIISSSSKKMLIIYSKVAPVIIFDVIFIKNKKQGGNLCLFVFRISILNQNPRVPPH